MMPPKQPKISQKLVLRSAIGLLALAGLVFAYQWYLGQKGNFGGISDVNSAGWIAAIEQTSDGSQAVYFDRKDEIHRSPEHKSGASEAGLAWQNDGNFIFFSSDAEASIFQIYRWNLQFNHLENRAPGRVSRTRPEMDPFKDDSVLFLQSGMAYRLDAAAGRSIRVFPPVERERAKQDDEGGTLGIDYDLVERYKLTSVKWLAENLLVGVQRLDEGEALIAQSTDLNEDETYQPYILLATGKKISFDVDIQTGTIYCAIAGFQFNPGERVASQFLKGTKVIPPFKNCLMRGKVEDFVKGFAEMGDVPKKHVMWYSSPKQEQVMGDITLSPDGTLLAACVGKPDSTQILIPTVLAIIPTDSSAGMGKGVVNGEVYQPSWSPDSAMIAYCQREGAESQSIFKVSKDGGSPVRVSPTTGIYSSPKFSPQIAKE